MSKNWARYPDILQRFLTDLDDTESRSESEDPEYGALLKALGFDPASADELAARSGLTIDQVSSMLLILELEGKIEAQSGGRYSRLGS